MAAPSTLHPYAIDWKGYRSPFLPYKCRGERRHIDEKEEGRNTRIGKGRRKQRKRERESKKIEREKGKKRAGETNKRKKKAKRGRRETKKTDEEVGRRENRGEATIVIAIVDDNKHPLHAE